MSPCLRGRRGFSRPGAGSGTGPNGIPIDPEIRRRLDHFHDRDLLERRQTASFDKRQLDQLSDELRELRGSKYEAQYAMGRSSEAVVLNAMGIAARQSISLTTYLLTTDHRLFGDLWRMMPA
jgi:hypothetical protein